MKARERQVLAITRDVSSGMGRCELSHLRREAIDIEIARAQHRCYEQTLEDLGCRVLSHPQEADLPDSVFVEDTAVVLDELAVIARSGAESRRPETESVAQALRPYRRLERIEPPGTLDGGDILRVGRKVFVGRSGRTNETGSVLLRDLLRPLGYEVVDVPVERCLHLKSAVTRIAERRLLVNPAWVDTSRLSDHELLEVDPREPFGANALRVADKVVYSTLYPRTRDRLVDGGVAVVELDVSELAKAEGGITCCSIVFEA